MEAEREVFIDFSTAGEETGTCLLRGRVAVSVRCSWCWMLSWREDRRWAVNRRRRVTAGRG